MLPLGLRTVTPRGERQLKSCLVPDLRFIQRDKQLCLFRVK